MIKIDLIRDRFYKAKESIEKTKMCPYSMELDGKDCCLVGNLKELNSYAGEKCPYLTRERHRVGNNPEVRVDEDRPDDVEREEYLDKELYQCSIPKEDVPDSALEVSPTLKKGYYTSKDQQLQTSQQQAPTQQIAKKKFIM